MEAQIKLSDRLFVKIEAANQKDLWQKLASIQEVFGEQKCGKCGNTNLRYAIRTIDGNDYYELICLKCKAKLSFGQHKNNNTLFVKRKSGDTWLPDNGWLKWDSKQQKMV